MKWDVFLACPTELGDVEWLGVVDGDSEEEALEAAGERYTAGDGERLEVQRA